MMQNWLIKLCFIRKRFQGFVLISLLTVAILLAVAFFVVNHQDIVNSDFSYFWLGGYMNRMNLNYYDSSVWIQEREKFGSTWNPAPFIYPAPMAIFLTPLSWLPLYPSYVLWVFLSEVIILYMVISFLSYSRIQHPLVYLFPIIAGIALFRPVLTTLMGGHIGPFYLLILLSVIYFFEKKNWFLGGVLAMIISLKPVLGLPLVALLSIWLILSKHLKGLLGISLSGMMLIILGILRKPNWIIEYLRIGDNTLNNTFGVSPTIWGISSYICNFNLRCSVGIGIGMLSILLLFFLWLVLVMIQKNGSALIIINAAICLSLIIPPYLRPYDQMLLTIPLLTILVYSVRRGFPYVISASIFLLADLLASIFLVIAVQLGMDQWSAMVPVIVLAVLLYVGWPSLPQEKPAHDYVPVVPSSIRQ